MTPADFSADAADVTEDGAYANSDSLLAQRGKSFHWARRLLSATHAERATRLYGFCRRIDDLVDENPSPVDARAALGAVRRALQTGQCDGPFNNAAWLDMLALMRDSGIDPTIPLELIQGVESDLDAVRVADMAELLRYSYRVAGTVGQMMTALLDVKTPEAMPHAIHLGIAMQLTNICRDVREDASRGRRYLPATLVGMLEPEALIAPTGATRATAAKAVCTLLDLAENYYASAEHGLHHLPAGARAGILVAARVYREIGVVLRRRDGDCWSSRAMVSAAGKTIVTLRALSDLGDSGRLNAAVAPPFLSGPRDSHGAWFGEATRVSQGPAMGALPRHLGTTHPEGALTKLAPALDHVN
jgi:15-cis-phytoene synthase